MPDNPNDRVVVLIPAYNEAQHLPAVVTVALAHLPVLVVDDGSSDETAAVAEAAGAAVLRQRPNQGKGAALRAGFRWAIEQGYQAVLTMDADGQHDPTEIPQFLQTYHANGTDLLIGARDFRQMPPVRRIANMLGGWSFSWAVGQTVRDNQSGYRLLSRRMIEAMLLSQEHGFEFEVEMIVVCLQRGFRLDWVPIRTIYGGESSHINPARHLFNFLRLVWHTHRRFQQAN